MKGENARRARSAPPGDRSGTRFSSSPCVVVSKPTASGLPVPRAARKPNEIEAKTGIERIGQSIELFPEQSLDNFGSAHRPASLTEMETAPSAGRRRLRVAAHLRRVSRRSRAMTFRERVSRVRKRLLRYDGFREAAFGHVVGRGKRGEIGSRPGPKSDRGWVTSLPNRDEFRARARLAATARLLSPARCRRNTIGDHGIERSAIDGKRRDTGRIPPGAAMVPSFMRASARAATAVPQSAPHNGALFRSRADALQSRSARSPPNR